MTERKWTAAKVMDASDRSYLEVVRPLLEGAKREIAISLYLMDTSDTAASGHPVNLLMESLLRARKRGVRVRIHLNTNFRIYPKEGVGRGRYFEALVQEGAELFTLLPSRRLHDKLIVIDGRYVVDGSMNWSESALRFNFESASVIDSREYARTKLERIGRLTIPPPPKERAVNRPLAPIPETVKIPKLILEKNYLPAMIRSSDMRSADLSLLLLGQSAALGAKEIEVDLETYGRALAFPESWNRSTVRRQMIKTLKKLAKRYRLIEVDFPFAKNARVKIKTLEGETFEAPGRLFEPEYLNRSSSAAAFLDLAREALKTEGVDLDTQSSPELEKRFGISKKAVVRARAESSA